MRDLTTFLLLTLVSVGLGAQEAGEEQRILFAEAEALAAQEAGTLNTIASQAFSFDGLIVDSSANVGIGLDDPDAMLVVGDDAGSAQIKVLETKVATNVSVMFNLDCNCPPGFRMKNSTSGDVWFFRQTAAGDFSLDFVAGTSLEARFDQSGNLFLKGALTQGSSRSQKHDLQPASGEDVLRSLERLDLYEWSYLDRTERHFGPMAEDFREAFGFGHGDTSIAPADMAGVALAAAKTLREENRSLKSSLEVLLERLDRLEKAVSLQSDVAARD